MDEIWHAAGDESADVDWYVKRTVLGGIYSTTELYMLTDASPGIETFLTTLDHYGQCQLSSMENLEISPERISPFCKMGTPFLICSFIRYPCSLG